MRSRPLEEGRGKAKGYGEKGGGFCMNSAGGYMRNGNGD